MSWMEPKSNPFTCAECEATLMDALDGILTQEEQLAFDRHLATCAECSAMVSDAQRGGAWLEMLKPERPEPPADLMERIIAQTSGAPTLVPQPVSQPLLAGHNNVIPIRSRWASFAHAMTQPRFAMTAAMAFFSLAITSNMLGVNASDLRPGNIERTYYRTQSRAIQYYDNLGVVEQFQSRVHELQRMQDEDNEQSPAGTPQKQQNSAPTGPGGANGTSQRELPSNSNLSAFRRDFASPANRRYVTEGVQA